jgi:hypothetical protein
MLKLGYFGVPAEACRDTVTFLGKCRGTAVLPWCESALGCMQQLEVFYILVVCFRILRRRPSGRFGVWFRHKQEGFLFSKTPKLALRRTWPPVIWLQGFLSLGTRREVAHLHLVPRVRMSVAIHLLHLYALVPYTKKTLNIPLSFSLDGVASTCMCNFLSWVPITTTWRVLSL